MGFRGDELQGFIRKGVLNLQRIRVQEHILNGIGIIVTIFGVKSAGAPIQTISRNWQAARTQVSADLMRQSGFREDIQPAEMLIVLA